MKYTIVDKIAHIRFMCKKILPAVYDESLSYMEGLAKLTFKLNETITSVNALNDNVSVLNDSVVEIDQRVTTMENTLDNFLSEIEKEFEELTEKYDAEIDAKLAQVDEELEDVDRRVTALERSIDAKFAEFEARINETIRELTILVNSEINLIRKLYSSFEEEMKIYVQEKIDEALSQIPDLTNIYVIDPTTGELAKVQTAIHNVFHFNLVNALTIDEYNEIGMTINQWKSVMVKSVPRGMTIREWLHDAKKILLEQISHAKAKLFAYPHTFVYGYLSGNLVWHDENVDLNQQLIQTAGCYSCSELNTMAFTCDEINAFNITCSDYVMYANSIMVRSA